MLTLDQLNSALDRVSYKPGWSFRAYAHPFEGTWVMIQATVEDSYKPGEPTDLGIRSPLPPIRDEAQLHEWLAWRLGIIETHEMREWLKLDGSPLYDPHAPGAEAAEQS